jgi:hypothetical protein
VANQLPAPAVRKCERVSAFHASVERESVCGQLRPLPRMFVCVWSAQTAAQDVRLCVCERERGSVWSAQTAAQDVRLCVCVREGGGREGVCGQLRLLPRMFVCVCARVCVCVCVRERERLILRLFLG